jgi:hypothetical protein
LLEQCTESADVAKRTLTPEDEFQIAALRDRLISTVQFIEQVEEFPSGPQIRTVVEEAAANSDLRTLRLLARDIDEITLALAPSDKSRLTELLRERLIPSHRT